MGCRKGGGEARDLHTLLVPAINSLFPLFSLSSSLFLSLTLNAQPAVPGMLTSQGELLHWMVQTPQSGKVVITEAMYADGIMEGMARHGLL